MPVSRPLLDTFPYEILEKIIFSIPTYEKKDLRNCALASKALIVPAQRSIFFNICLWDDSYAPALIYLFKRSPHLGAYVRELELTCHPRSTRGAENAAQLFKLMPSVRCLYLNRLDTKTPWEVMKSSLEDVILPRLRCLRIWCVDDGPVWLVSSCRQLDELHVNDCPSVLDETSVVGLQRVDSLPLRYLSIADLGSELFDFLRRSVTQLVTLDLPICDGRYNTVEDRSRMPLTRLPELMNPMANTLVCLKVDAWPILHLRK
ncbi:hypothetical protein DL96DRAFT_1610987 [Flagelloscypha sp. PMI_526]|nr:hypothetical protein DL96DRAFT_1610987 [Flagelloscypha sp. PMI_526]